MWSISTPNGMKMFQKVGPLADVVREKEDPSFLESKEVVHEA